MLTDHTTGKINRMTLHIGRGTEIKFFPLHVGYQG